MRNLSLLVLSLGLACSAALVSATTVYAPLPPIPRYAPTALGQVEIFRVPGPFKCGEVKYAMGCFHRGSFRLEVQDSLPLTLAWQVVHHELFHEALAEEGITFDDPAVEDQIAEVVAKQRVLHMRAGWPVRR